MQRRSRPLSLREFGNFMRQAFSHGTAIGLIIAIIANLLGCSVGWALQMYESNNNARIQKVLYSYGQMEHDRSEAVRAARRQMATGVIALHDKGKQEGMESPTGFDEEILTELRKMKLTGDALVLPTTYPSWGEWWVSPVMLALTAVLLMALAGLHLFCYAYCIGRSFFLADLPWRKAWPWAVTLLLGPPFWVGMAVSAVRMLLHPGQRPAKTVLPDYPSDPDAAAARYEQLRGDGRQSQLMLELRQVESTLQDRRDACRTWAGRLREYQQEIGQLTIKERTLLRQLETPLQAGVLSSRQEFEKILTHPSVMAVDVEGDGLAIIVRAEFNYRGVIYDLGDWKIMVKTGQSRPDVVRLRTTKLENWQESEPPYYVGDSFCFGRATDDIEDAINSGHLFKALLKMIDCINDVNKDHQLFIPRVYPPKIGG